VNIGLRKYQISNLWEMVNLRLSFDARFQESISSRAESKRDSSPSS
jgi:hypothetical protein